MLAFRKKIWVPAIQKEFRLIDAIENRTKTQTVRNPNLRVNVGSLQPFGAPGHHRPGRLHILNKYTRPFCNLNDSEVAADGFACLADFYHLMRVLNPEFDQYSTIMVIKFEYLTPEQLIEFQLKPPSRV